jgi:malonyl-CoA O-methyltransferase
MKSETYKEIIEKLEKLKQSIPYLESKIKTKNKKEIEDSVAYLVYILHRIHKKATEKSTVESIEDLSNRIWWFKLQKEKNKSKRKFMNVDELYNEWSRKYDKDPNLLIFLEEQVSKKFIGNVKNKEVLDYGCGTGRYSIPLAKQGANVTAIDFSKGMLNQARKKAKKLKVKIDFYQEEITKYKPNKKFDLIISMLVLDHIKDLNKFIEVINEASITGTQLVVSNVHPEILRKGVDIKTGRTQGYLREKRETNQFYHPLSEYIELMLNKGFVLTKIEDLIYDKKYYSNKRLFNKFKIFAGVKDKAIGIIMKFEKIK